MIKTLSPTGVLHVTLKITRIWFVSSFTAVRVVQTSWRTEHIQGLSLENFNTCYHESGIFCLSFKTNLHS